MIQNLLLCILLIYDPLNKTLLKPLKSMTKQSRIFHHNAQQIIWEFVKR